MTLMPLASNAWPSTGEMLASAPGNEPGTGFDEPDVGSEVGEDRGNLASGVGSADDRNLVRQGFEGQDVVIGPRELAARDR
jgi:hypothetical protein